MAFTTSTFASTTSASLPLMLSRVQDRRVIWCGKGGGKAVAHGKSSLLKAGGAPDPFTVRGTRRGG